MTGRISRITGPAFLPNSPVHLRNNPPHTERCLGPQSQSCLLQDLHSIFSPSVPISIPSQSTPLATSILPPPSPAPNFIDILLTLGLRHVPTNEDEKQRRQPGE